MLAPVQNESAGVISRILDSFPVGIAVPDEQLHENIRSALSRNLPEVKQARRHNRVMSVAAGGPSLGDTWRDLDGVIVAVNGSLRFLLERGVTPWACGIFDARPHMADLIEPHPDVFFFLGSTCHPRLFDKLAGCKIGIWHPSGMPGIEETTNGATLIAGGSTMGLRWLNLGYFMGFRHFRMHGLDSSFRGKQTHAYPDFRDGFSALDLLGYKTSMNFIQQIDDWFHLKHMFATIEDPPIIELHGYGLLQYLDRQCSTSSA